MVGINFNSQSQLTLGEPFSPSGVECLMGWDGKVKALAK